MKKTFTDFKSDTEAEQFVDTADLSQYDFSDMRPMLFELRPKNRSVSLRLPEALLAEVRARAMHAGIPYQRFMRLAIERAINDPKPEGF